MHIKDFAQCFARVCKFTEALFNHLFPLGHLCHGSPLPSDGTGTLCLMELHLLKRAIRNSCQGVPAHFD